MSSTAHGVAAIRAQETAQDPAIRLFNDPYAAALGGEAGKEFLRPNLIDRSAVRTRKIDDEISKAVNADKSSKSVYWVPDWTPELGDCRRRSSILFISLKLIFR